MGLGWGPLGGVESSSWLLDRVAEGSASRQPVVLLVGEGQEDPLGVVGKYAEARRRRHVRLVMGAGQVRGVGEWCDFQRSTELGSGRK